MNLTVRWLIRLLRGATVISALLLTACASSTGSLSSAPAAANSAGNADIIRSALYQQYREWQGTDYAYGGLSKSGVDCSGFVYLTFRDRLGVSLPRTTRTQSQIGRQIPAAQLRPGDLVFFITGNKSRHVGIYVADNQFLHASKSRGVMLSDLNNPYWRETYWHARRI